jgi:hypothetical protein
MGLSGENFPLNQSMDHLSSPMYGNPQISFRFEEVDECLVLRKPSGWEIDDNCVPASPAAMRPRGNMGRFVEPWGSSKH